MYDSRLRGDLHLLHNIRQTGDLHVFPVKNNLFLVKNDLFPVKKNNLLSVKNNLFRVKKNTGAFWLYAPVGGIDWSRWEEMVLFIP